MPPRKCVERGLQIARREIGRVEQEMPAEFAPAQFGEVLVGVAHKGRAGSAAAKRAACQALRGVTPPRAWYAESLEVPLRSGRSRSVEYPAASVYRNSASRAWAGNSL